MAGIFGNRGFTPFAPMEDEYGMGTGSPSILPGGQFSAPEQRGGIFSFMGDSPEMSSADKWEILGAGLQDMIAPWNPDMKGGNLDAADKRVQKNRLKRALKGMMKPDGTADFSKLRSLLLDNVDDVGDVGTIMQMGQRQDRPPTVTGGMYWDENSRSWLEIPQYVDQQRAIYDARAKATARYRAPRSGGGTGGGGAPKPPTGFILD